MAGAGAESGWIGWLGSGSGPMASSSVVTWAPFHRNPVSQYCFNLAPRRRRGGLRAMGLSGVEPHRGRASEQGEAVRSRLVRSIRVRFAFHVVVRHAHRGLVKPMGAALREGILGGRIRRDLGSFERCPTTGGWGRSPTAASGPGPIAAVRATRRPLPPAASRRKMVGLVSPSRWETCGLWTWSSPTAGMDRYSAFSAPGVSGSRSWACPTGSASSDGTTMRVSCTRRPTGVTDRSSSTWRPTDGRTSRSTPRWKR